MSELAVKGLPERLPAGETVIWQGSPSFRGMAVHVFRIRFAALYFGALLAWLAVSSVANGSGPVEAARSLAPALAATLVALAVLAGVAWLSSRTTTYTITDRRVVLHIGMALPMSVNVPFAIVESADLRIHADATGDIPLAIRAGDKIAYLALWPHARPWRFASPEPTLRGIPEVARVAEILARALAAAAGQRDPQTVAAPNRRAPSAAAMGHNVGKAGAAGPGMMGQPIAPAA